MTAMVILVLLACLALAWFVYRMRSTHAASALETDLSERFCSVDLEAFRNLVDQEEEAFLRANLAPAEFRRIQRQRLRAAIDYVGGVSQNAGLLLKLGQFNRSSPDPRVAEAGRELVDSASRLRISSFLAGTKLYGRILFPAAGLETAAIVGQYEQTKERAALLARLRDPGSAGIFPRAL
jgi:hypothetical protein